MLPLKLNSFLNRLKFVSTPNKINVLGYDAATMSEFITHLGLPKFRAKQLIHWFHHEGVNDFAAMSNFSKDLRAQLPELIEAIPPEISLELPAMDGTIKWLMRLPDGVAVETVYIPDKTRGTLCVSSQVGCALNCSFCSTGKEGFNRNLTSAEIIGQVWLARRRLRALQVEGYSHHAEISNVVMMGMGEPLLNYDNVLQAMNLMLDDFAYGLSKYKVTLSTSGVLPAMVKLKQDSEVALAVSLHAPTNEIRNKIVPINKKYPLEQLIPVCRDYFAGHKKRSVTFEYVMLKGVNDSLAEAKALIQLVGNFPCKMNLIPFNPFPGTHYECSDTETIIAFQNKLIAAGINTRVRKTRGQAIDAACGQLAGQGQVKDRTGRHQRWLKTGRLVVESTNM